MTSDIKQYFNGLIDKSISCNVLININITNTINYVDTSDYTVPVYLYSRIQVLLKTMNAQINKTITIDGRLMLDIDCIKLKDFISSLDKWIDKHNSYKDVIQETTVYI